MTSRSEKKQTANRPQKRLLTVEETAEYLSVSPKTIYNAISRKTARPFPIKPKRIGKLVRFDIRDLDRYVESI